MPTVTVAVPTATVAVPGPVQERSVRATSCKDGTPVIEVAPVDPGLGNRWVVVTVHNCESTALTLRNKPSVTAVTGRGEKSVLSAGGALHQPYGVPPGGSAYFGLHYRGGGSSEDPEGRVNRVDYQIPEVGTATVLEFTDLAGDSSSEVTGWFPTERVFG